MPTLNNLMRKELEANVLEIDRFITHACLYVRSFIVGMMTFIRSWLHLK